MRDRLSIHVENGQSDIYEAVTILRNGGTVSQSGLVGITNKTYASDKAPFMPQTILNVQSEKDSNIRFSSGPSKSYRSSLELLGNGNTRASGLHISYDPQLDDALIVADDGTGYGYDPCVNPQAVDNTVVDFSLIRPSGTEGMEFSHISMSERGYVAIGLTRAHKDRHHHPNAPLTVAYACDGHQDSGTISMHEQAASPAAHTDFGKIYVKPFTTGGRTQALYFKDDGGNETNLVLSQDLDSSDSRDGLLWGDIYCNTYGGWDTPAVRTIDSSKTNNTYYGKGAGFNLSDAGTVNCNTLIGYKVGSGLTPSDSNDNTVVGCNSLKGYTSANRNTIVGQRVVLNNSSNEFGGMDDCILLGRNMFISSIPEDFTLAIGYGSSPIISGKMSSNGTLFVNNSLLNVNKDDFATQISNEYQKSNIDFIDSDSTQAYIQREVRFRFMNKNGNSRTFFSLKNPSNTWLTNSASYQASPGPYAHLDSDLRLRGAIRFQDGTSLSGISEFNLIPIVGTSGIAKRVHDSKNHLVFDFSSLGLAGNIHNDIATDNTFIPAQLGGRSSNKVGVMSLQGLSDYIGSGFASMAENCNALFSNAEGEKNINTAANARSVMIGCEVAQFASGWKNAVIIGADAGNNATTPNSSLNVDTPVIFIGHKAGTNADNITNAIFIGEDAGSEAAGSEKSIFIGSNAGQKTNSDESIGIGFNALRGSDATSVDENNRANVEIVAGLLDNQRLMYQQSLSSRLNVQNTIAGRTDEKNISIGDARLTPTAPLEVRRDSITHANNGNNYVQTWYCDDALVASVDCNGAYTNHVGGGGSDLFVEGKLAANMTAGNYTTPSTVTLNLRGGGTVQLSNRDSNLTAPINTYVVAIKMGEEYRPIWVSC